MSVVLPVRLRWPRRIVSGVVFRDVDFNSPLVLGGIFGRVVFERCQFSLCQFGGVNAAKVDFVGCEFEDCSVGLGSAAVMDGCRVLRSSATALRIASLQFMRGEISETRLLDVKWTNVIVKESTVESVSIAGSVRTANFIACRLAGVDLSEAILRDFSLVGGELSRVSVPRKPTDFFVPAGALLECVELLRERLSESDMESYSRIANAFGRVSYSFHVDQEVFQQMSDRGRTVLLDALFGRALQGFA